MEITLVSIISFSLLEIAWKTWSRDQRPRNEPVRQQARHPLDDETFDDEDAFVAYAVVDRLVE